MHLMIQGVRISVSLQRREWRGVHTEKRPGLQSPLESLLLYTLMPCLMSVNEMFDRGRVHLSIMGAHSPREAFKGNVLSERCCPNKDRNTEEPCQSLIQEALLDMLCLF